jgi:hypothetical protein
MTRPVWVLIFSLFFVLRFMRPNLSFGVCVSLVVASRSVHACDLNDHIPNTLSTGHALLFTFGVLLVVDAPLATRISAPHVCNLAGRASVFNLRTTKRSAPHACKLQLVNAKHQQRPSGWLLERKKALKRSREVVLQVDFYWHETFSCL